MARDIDIDTLITLAEFEAYYKSSIDEQEKQEVQRLILVAQDKLIAENNTAYNLLQELTDEIVADTELVYITKALRHLVRYYFEEGVDKQAASVSMNVGSKNISKTQDGENNIPETVYQLFGRTKYYTDEEFVDLNEETDETDCEGEFCQNYYDKLVENSQDIIENTEAIAENKDSIDTLGEEVEQNKEDIEVLENNINLINQTFSGSVAGALIAANTETRLNITQQRNTYGANITFEPTTDTFIIGENDIADQLLDIRATIDIGSSNMDATLRIYKESGNTLVYETTELITDSGAVHLLRNITLEANTSYYLTYECEVQSRTSGVSITITGTVSGGFVLLKSSQVLDDSETAPEGTLGAKVKDNSDKIQDNSENIETKVNKFE